MLARHTPRIPKEQHLGRAKPGRFTRFLTELKRREVFKVTGVYLVAAWGLSAGGAEILPTLGFPEWSARLLVISLFAATPIVALLAWLYEFSDRGIERDFGPDRLTDQETVIASSEGVPALTAHWQNQSLQFVTGFDIGRDERCGLQLLDPMISRRHARVEFEDGGWQLRDLGSANGTEVNGHKVEVIKLPSRARVVFYPGGAPLNIDIASLEANASTVVALNSNLAI